jgi:methylmalonyl-CoA mutase N-terminal domain/subunit
LAFTLRDGMEYVEACLQRGLDVDSFAPRLSFFFNSHNEFFEEICKLRAARRIWANAMRFRFGAKQERSWLMRTHVQTAGCSLTEQQPMNNIVRVAYQALAGVLGGCQSLHTDSMDETLGLPTEAAVRVALRTQQILAHETGVHRTVDPLGGSWFVEALTDRMETDANEFIKEIDDMGGVVAGIHKGYFRRQIAEASYRFGQEMEAGDRVIVGVNAYPEGNEDRQMEILQIPHEVESQQNDRLTKFRSERNADLAKKGLDGIRAAARAGQNVMPSLVQASLDRCTLGEMVQAMADVYGRYAGGPEW